MRNICSGRSPWLRLFHMNQQHAAKYDLENTWTQNRGTVRISIVNYHHKIMLPSEIKILFNKESLTLWIKTHSEIISRFNPISRSEVRGCCIFLLDPNPKFKGILRFKGSVFHSLYHSCSVQRRLEFIFCLFFFFSYVCVVGERVVVHWKNVMTLFKL